MAIKMRNNTDKEAICCECGNAQDKVLNMFDLCIGGTKFTICDECNEKIFYKCLKANVTVNERLKSPRDMAIISKRRSKAGFK